MPKTNWARLARIVSTMLLCSALPYALLSLGYAWMSDGGVRAFWHAVGVLVALRIFFALIEAASTAIYWWVQGKKLAAQLIMEFMQANEFPKRMYSDDDFLRYLAGIEGGDRYPAKLQGMAKMMYWMLSFVEGMGIFIGMRMHAATDAALELYSPKANAPAWGSIAAYERDAKITNP